MKLLSVKPSSIPEKKLKATFEKDDGQTKTTHFGQRGADDFTKTGDKEQRRRYIERHGRGAENWRDPTSAGALSRFILWGSSVSLARNIAAFKSKFNL